MSGSRAHCSGRAVFFCANDVGNVANDYQQNQLAYVPAFATGQLAFPAGRATFGGGGAVHGRVQYSPPLVKSSSFLAPFGLVLAIIALAGFVDAYSFVKFNKLFVSFMSGNTTSLGVATAHLDGDKLHQLPLVIGLFVGGVVLGTWLHTWAGRWSAALILVVVSGLLGLAYARPALAVAALTLGMGVLNASVHEVRGVKVSLTFVTGALVKFGAGLAELLSSQHKSWEWLWQITLWVAFVLGAFAGGLALLHLPQYALLLAAGFSLVLAGAASLVHGLGQGPPEA